jgi:hypothetical protein
MPSVRASSPRLVGLAILNIVLAVVGIWLLTSAGSGSPRPDAGPAPVHPFTAAPQTRVPEPLPTIGEPVRPTTGPRAATATSERGCTLQITAGHLVIPALCVDAPVVATSLTEGSLRIPQDVHTVGWWAESAGFSAQGSATGTTLLAGHVNLPGQGSGALSRLGSVRPHDLVYTADHAGVVSRWRVVSLSEVRKDRLPSDVFAGRTGPRRLVMVTCGGPIIRVAGHGAAYRDNVIVTAAPA